MHCQCCNCGHREWDALFVAPAFDCALAGNPAAATGPALGVPAQPSQPSLQKQEYGIARCRSCRLVNTTGFDSATVAATYTPQYYGSAAQKFTPVIEKIVARGNAARAKKITQLWRRDQAHQRAPQVLDIGCGRGQLLRAFQDAGASVLGLERAEFLDAEPMNSFVQSGALSDSQFAQRRFDIIILWHVFEHLEAPEALLQTFTEHLNEQGLLVIAVPNFASLQRRLFSKYWFHLDLPRHLVHIESHWLQQQLKQRGFRIEKLSYMDPLQNVYGFIQSALNACAPGRLNRYYGLLKHGRARTAGSSMALLGWSLAALLLTPFALLDSLLGSLTGQGATVEIAARRGPTK